MADNQLDVVTAALVSQLASLAKLLKAHQAHIFAIEAYLQEQPGYNPARFHELFVAFQENAMAHMERDSKTLDSKVQAANDELLELLRDFEGPTQ